MLVHHLDLDTVWGLDEADPDAVDSALDLAVARVRSRGDYPGLRIHTVEGDDYVIGDGATPLRGSRAAVLGWLTRGLTEGVGEGRLPERPRFG